MGTSKSWRTLENMEKAGLACLCLTEASGKLPGVARGSLTLQAEAQKSGCGKNLSILLCAPLWG